VLNEPVERAVAKAVVEGRMSARDALPRAQCLKSLEQVGPELVKPSEISDVVTRNLQPIEEPRPEPSVQSPRQAVNLAPAEEGTAPSREPQGDRGRESAQGPRNLPQITAPEEVLEVPQGERPGDVGPDRHTQLVDRAQESLVAPPQSEVDLPQQRI